MIRLALLVVTLLAGEAAACSCGRLTSFFPPSGSVVPTNVVFQVTQNIGGVPAFTLFVANSDQAVPLVVTSHGTAWATLDPVAALMPGATYTLRDATGERTASFTVAAGPDDVAPASRALKSTTRNFVAGGGSTCGSSESLQLVVDGMSEPETALLVFSGASPGAVGADPSAFTEDGVLLDSLCTTNFGLRGVADVAVGVRVVDFAGNVSELSEVKQAKTAGCSAAPGALAVVAVAVFFRRKRKAAS